MIFLQTYLRGRKLRRHRGVKSFRALAPINQEIIGVSMMSLAGTCRTPNTSTQT